MTTEDALRRILAAEAESVDVAPDALNVIRRRIAKRRARWWHGWRPSALTMLSFTGGTAVVAAAAVAVALASAPKPAREPQQPAGPPGPPAAVSVPPTANLPVYYLGDTSSGVRLFREYHLIRLDGPDAAARTRAALRTMLATHSPVDPDYRTPWQEAGVNSVRVDGDAVLVDLHGVPASVSDQDTARMAVQQLVWTATAASGATALQVSFDGQKRASLWGVSGLDGRLQRGARADVQAPIWLIDPQQGAQVGRPVAVYIAATAAGGTVHLRVTGTGGQLVSDQAVTLSAAAPQQGEAHPTLNLVPGTYVVTAYVSWPSGADRDADSHEITVS
jgi:Sporulation and spore germination